MSERDWATSEYVRVYYSIVTDEKFKTVYSDDHALAAWLRLLIGADATYPMPAPMPASVAKKALRVLTDAGLVTISGAHYRISGLDKERAHRFNGGKGRPRYPSDGTPKPQSSRNDSESTGASSEPPRSDSESPVRASASASVSGSSFSSLEGGSGETSLPPLTVVIDYLEERTGRAWHGRPGQALWDTLDADLRQFGADALLENYRAFQGDRLDFGQIVFGVSNRLHPIASADTKQLAKEERDADERRASAERFAATRRFLDEQERKRGAS